MSCNVMTAMSRLKLYLILSILPLSTFSYAKLYDWVVLGDSISSGYGVDSYDNWVNKVDRATPCSTETINLSVQGATSTDGLTTIKDFYRTNQSKFLIIELGGNDALRGNSLTTLAENINSIINIAQKNESTVILIGVDLPPNYGKLFRNRFQSLFEDIAKTRHIIYKILDFPNNPEFLQPDGIHPNANGHQAIYDALAPMLLKLLCPKQC